MQTYSLILTVIVLLNLRVTELIELNGPELASMPARMTHFSNTVGLTLTCVGRGPPPLTISWLSGTGEELSQIPGIREELQNGSLYFPPFKPEDYIPTVHNGEYRCSVRNPVGTFLSPVLSVRAIVDHPFEVMILLSSDSNDLIIEGSPALLSCDVTPSFYSQFVRIIAWKSIDQFGHATEILENDSRYKIIKDGSLLIFNTKHQQLFVCIGQSSLNRKSQVSAPFLLKAQGGRIVPNPKRVNLRHPNSLVGQGNVIRGEMGKTTDITCLAVGSPSPTFRWEKYHKGKFVPVTSVLGSSAKTQGPLLRLTQTNPFHNGTYRCEVSNSLGTFSVDYTFLLESNPSLVIEPRRKVARNGESIELSCNLQANSSLGIGLYNNSNVDFMWFKDGKRLNSKNGQKKSQFHQKLQIFNSKLEDQGVYQCFAEVLGAEGVSQSVHASSSIMFESSTPELVNTFISQSLQPGPFITLKCSAVGNPIPKITWTIDNTPVHQNEQEYWAQQQYTRISIGSYQLHNSETVSHLNISGIQVENSGVYKCEASNLVGFSFHSARLNIYGRIFVKEMSALTLVAGQRALIPCHYGGYPVDKVGWQKDSRDIEALEGTTGFENDGKRTSGSERFTIFANGTLQIEKVNRDTDKGRYACVISNRKGEIASGSVDVNVMRSPVISPFRFDDDLREGQRTSASCNVISGDLPIDIIWFKDSSPIPNWLNVTENRVKFLSVLIFEELHHEHSGEFTCSVSNAAATVTQSATLNVKVPPKWTKEPESVKVILKSDHILPCSATGVPQPTINWYRESVVGRIKYAIKSNDKLLLREDGALKILQVGETDASNYICEAVNGVGSGISKSIRLDVIIPAKVSAPMTSIVVAEGLPALLKCEIRGDSPVQVSWKKGSVIMEPQHSSARLVQHQTIVDGNSSVLFAELRIDPSERADSGLYVCIASNQYGRDEDRINLEVKARPDPPENFMVEEIGSRFIRLGWSVAASKESRVLVTSFLLQWKRSSTLSWESGQVYNRSVESSSTHAKLESLNPVTNYDIRVFASNDFGHGFPTEALTILTLPEAPSGSPTNVSGIPIGPRVVLVKWEPPDVSLQHGEILGYQVTANLQSPLGLGTNQKGNEQVIIDQKWGLQAELKELLPNSQYKISVKAYNSAGMGPLSPFLFIQTPEGAPDSPPIHLGCEALSPKSLQVQWEPPPFHLSNGQILGYKVIYLPLQAEEFGEKGEVKKTSNRETTLHGLRSFTSYSVRVLGYTHGGESKMSTPVTCRTEEDVPEEPADIKVVSLSSTSALVSWLPPTSSNGVITKYTVFWKSGESETVKEKQVVTSSESNSEDDEFHLEIRRLRESLPYSVWVKASTSVGTGRATRTETFQLGSLLPARIASFASVKNKELGQPLRLACKSVGIPLPDVFWFKNDLPLPSHNLLRNGSLFINRIKGLDEGVYICRAQNEHGSDEIEHRVIISRPPSSVPIFVGYVTDSSIQIHWDPPEKAEPPLSAYVLQYQQQKDSLSLRDWVSTRMGPRLTSYLVENLLCGTQYSFRIFGENSVGKGEMSLVLSARTNGNLPEMPKLTEILDGNGTMIRIDLMRWSDGGCPITNFNIEYKKESTGNWLRIYRRDNSSRVFIIQTQLYSKYEIKIRVENDAGSVTKVFKVESYPDFFTNYAKVLERVEKEVGMNGSYVSLYTDPHVLVPIVSALICTFAVAICVLMLIKRKNQSRPEWKFKQSSSQQTWLSSSDAASKCAGGIGESVSGCPEAMSIYATLNSTKPIPMTIRDSTVRFQSFGQHDNYEAPNNAMTAEFTKRSRRKSCASSPLEEMCMQQVSCQMEIEPPTEFRSSSASSIAQQQQQEHFRSRYQHPAETDNDGMYHDYSCPYQFIAGTDNRNEGTQNTLRKQLSSSSSNKFRLSRDSSEFF